jgi:FtsP/CotA-like multicopper oxidase with cupredoxin domain
MALPTVPALLFAIVPLLQDAIVAPPPRAVVPRPAARAPMVRINDNRTPAGARTGRTLTLSLDIVDAAWQPEGEHDPIVRAFAFAESGQQPSVPGPLLRAPVGTTVRLTVRNRTDSALVLHGLRTSLPDARDTAHVAAGQSRELTFTLDAVGNHYYWAGLPKVESSGDREWLDSQLNGALIVDAPNAKPPTAQERIWVISEWFYPVAATQSFESALVFNGKAWPYNERLTFSQNDSVHFRVLNTTALEHPLHLHGFYFRVAREGDARTDKAVPNARQALQNMYVINPGQTVSLSFVPTTPGNWPFHCHFASHVGDISSLHGTPDPAGTTSGAAMNTMPAHDAPGGHTMRGLVIGMHVTPAPGYREPVVTDRRVINLLIQQKAGELIGRQMAYGFLLQKGTDVPARDSLDVPGPLLELKRGQPVRIVVQNNLTEPSGVHWHGLEIESYPDGVPDFSGIGDRITPPIPAGKSFAAEFTPPRNGTFPYHSHLHELRQIGSGMYGAIIVTDTPRDTLRDHVIVAGGGGLPVFSKQGPSTLLVNGRFAPRPIRMTAGDSHRLRIVSIHADEILHYRLGSDTAVVKWTALARDGADLPPALRKTGPALVEMGPGETADFTFVPSRPGKLQLEVWITRGQRVVVPIEVTSRRVTSRRSP